MLSVEKAALALHLNAISVLDEPQFPKALSNESNNSLNTLIYLTRSAATIMSLHIEELKPKGAARANEVLTMFEQKLFPQEPCEEALALLHEVRELMKLIHTLRTSPSTKSDAELLQQLASWGEVWLAILPDGETIFEQLGKLGTFLLVGGLVTDFKLIDSLVLNTVYGK